MAYRRAWAAILLLIATTVFAIWRSYFGILSAAPTGFHVHGVTATLWMLLLLLARAALARGDATVARIAHRIGYTSQSAFGHAFRRAFGAAPKAMSRGSIGTKDGVRGGSAPQASS